VSQSTTVQTVEFLKTGTRLIFRPYVGDDGFIRMEVHPEDSDGKVVNGLPSKTTTEVTTNVIVKDGHTVVIGGLFRESSTRSRTQVPGLGNLPLVGALFRHQEDATIREEIIILLTPHIIKDDRAYSAASEAELKEAEKMRVGIRRGMMPWGRERLAETCYDSAVREMQKTKGDRKKALFFLDCATNLNPKFLEAIRMKESLTGRELASVDNSTIRSFLRKQILLERAVTGATEPVEPKKAAPAGKPAALAPTTRPVEAVVSAPVAAATQRPATQPVMAVDRPTTRPAAQPPAVERTNTEPLLERVERALAGVLPRMAAPAMPRQQDDNAKGVVVTELGDEEEEAVATNPTEEQEGQELDE
jgi:type IV pilus assembly protein PilQ